MGEIKERMKAELELRCYSKSTQDEYLRYSERFVGHFMLSPTKMGEAQVWKYLLYLKREKEAGPATLKGNVAALKFLYTHTLRRPEEVARIPWPKVPRPLPDILSGSEVGCLLTSIHSFHHRVITMTAYGSGLRIGETCSLKPGDIDSKRMLIHIRDGKRGRDRYVMLPERVLEWLREYWRMARPRSPWLFPGRDPEHHISKGAVQEAVRKAARDAGISKRVTPHVLRHSFATHLLETGTDIRTIQVLLGHNSIRTTERYTRVSKAHVGRVKSPLDLLGTKDGEPLG